MLTYFPAVPYKLYCVYSHIQRAPGKQRGVEVETEDEPRSNGNDRRGGDGMGKEEFFTVSRLCVSKARLAFPRGLPALSSQFRRLYSITFVLGVRSDPGRVDVEYSC